jgi:hypothetical protein
MHNEAELEAILIEHIIFGRAGGSINIAVKFAGNVNLNSEQTSAVLNLIFSHYKDRDNGLAGGSGISDTDAREIFFPPTGGRLTVSEGAAEGYFDEVSPMELQLIKNN